MTEIDRYAVFGNPIKQTKSPVIHTLFAEQCSHQLQYRAVKVELDGFVKAAQRFFDDGGAGLNVTVPFKGEAFDFADTLSERAQRAGAVNTLTRGEDGTITGDNTDGIGLVRDMVVNLGWAVQGLRVLLLGAGGAARGILEPLLRERPRELLVVNRNGELFLYENKCPHVNDSLDPMGGSVARAAAQMVFCQRHGAEFLSHTGECVSGPCLGEFLNVIPFTLSNGDIYLD